MRTLLPILIGFVVLNACSTRQERKMQTPDPTALRQDTVAASREAVQAKSENADSLKVETPRFFNDPLRNLNDFAVETNNPVLNKYIADLSNSNDAVETIKTGYCWGDCCGSYKKLEDRAANTALYLFKVDGGEYSFGNDQFLFINDTLKIVRHFYCGVFDYRTDSTAPSFEMKEKMILFEKDKALIKERRKVLRGEENYTLRDVDFNVTEGDWAALQKEKTEELRTKIYFTDSLKGEN